MVSAAADMVGISFPKLKRFAHILNLKFMEKTTFYRLRGYFYIILVFIYGAGRSMFMRVHLKLYFIISFSIYFLYKSTVFDLFNF